MTSRQFYIMFWIVVISLKIQKMPSVMYEYIGKDFYLMLLPYLVINVIGIFMAFYILKRTQDKSLAHTPTSKWWSAFQKIIVFLISVYFLAQALLLYETTRNLFEHILFDNLSWVVFSLILLAVVFYLAHTGIGNIALNAELYFYIILAGYLLIAAFGAFKADFSFIFPLQTIDMSKIIGNFIQFNIWFGDFFIVLFLGKHASQIKLKWTFLTYFLAMGLVALLYLEFGGIFGEYTIMKPSLISTITEQSLLDLNIGRVDWFLILFTEIGTILSCGICVYFSKKCLKFALPKVKSIFLLIAICASLYLINVLYLVDTHTRIQLFMNYITHVAALTKWVPFVIMFVICLLLKRKTDKNPQNILKARQKQPKKTQFNPTKSSKNNNVQSKNKTNKNKFIINMDNASDKQNVRAYGK